MNPTSSNCRIEWFPVRLLAEWMRVTVTAADPSPEARICYTATWP